MEIIVLNKVNKSKQTRYRTDYTGGCQYKGQVSIIILTEKDLSDLKKLSTKLRGYTVDKLIIPKKFEDTFNELPYFEYIAPQFSLDFELIVV